MQGGTGSLSKEPEMPDFLPDRGEAGTLNVPGIAGLSAGLAFLQSTGIDTVAAREQRQLRRCARGLEKLGFRVFCGDCQSGAISFVPEGDCEELAQGLGGLHCAPLAHESAGTLSTGTVRVSFGWDARDFYTNRLLKTLEESKKIMNNYCHYRPNPL